MHKAFPAVSALQLVASSSREYEESFTQVGTGNVLQVQASPAGHCCVPVTETGTLYRPDQNIAQSDILRMQQLPFRSGQVSSAKVHAGVQQSSFRMVCSCPTSHPLALITVIVTRV